MDAESDLEAAGTGTGVFKPDRDRSSLVKHYFKKVW